ncbi:MAG: heparan-alpha-glucosaminide N-acetyltransferase domain-containing protein [Bryobacter sp.]
MQISTRLASLDVFRGLTIALMILVNTPGDGRTTYAPLQHVPWHGWTITDGVFPSFVWIIGLAVTLVVPRRLASGLAPRAILSQAARRTAILFGLGVFLYAFPHFNLETFRILGVLQRLALCYFATVLAVLYFPWRAQLGLAFGLLAAYWIAMVSYGPLTVEGNLAHAIDRAILGSHNYGNTKTWDPEGILSTVPAIASCLLGAVAGKFLKVPVLLFSGLVLAIAGQLAGFFFPINKMLWSPSFVLWMAGLDAILMGALLWIVDQKGWRAWARPFEWMGMNAITLYLVSEFVEITLQWRGWKEPIYRTVFLPLASPYNASLLYALTYVALHAVLAYWLWRKKIFLRV